MLLLGCCSDHALLFPIQGRVAVAFVWITFVFALATTIVLFAVDSEARYINALKHDAWGSVKEKEKTHDLELPSEGSLARTPAVRSLLLKRKEKRDNVIEEVPVDTKTLDPGGPEQGTKDELATR